MSVCMLSVSHLVSRSFSSSKWVAEVYRDYIRRIDGGYIGE